MMTTLYPLLLRGRWILLCLFLLSLTTHARSLLDTTGITLNVENQPIETVFKLIEKQTGLIFFYGNAIINRKTRTTIHVKEASISEVMRLLLKGHNVTWTIRNGGIVLSKQENAMAEQLADSIPLIDVSGIVTDVAGKPLVGTTVTVKGQTRGQGTDSQGRFSFSRIASNGILVFSSLGYDAKQIRVNGRSTITVVLDTAIRVIEGVEVVSTGYQDIPRERSTGSFVKISNQVYNEQVGTNILDRLPSITSSMGFIPQRSGTTSADITIRGLSTFAGPKQPLIIVDNFPFEGNLNNINPNDVADITILRDAAAASIWGARAGNGVIVIKTKSGKFNSKLNIEFSSTISVTAKPDLGYIPTISTTDFVDVEQFLFNNGYYDGDLDFNPIGYQTPVVDILDKIRKGEISEAEGKAALDKLRKNDVRKEYEKYSYRNSINQQYALSFSGGSQNNAWHASASYDRNLGELSNKYQRYTVRLENVFKPIDKLQLLASINYSQSDSKSGRPGYGEISEDITPPYTQFKNESGLPLGIATWRRAFLDTVGQGLLLDWNLYPTEDYKHTWANQSVANLRARFGVRFNVVDGVSLDINYQLEKEQASEEKIQDLQAFYTRDLINKFTIINYDNHTLKQNVPHGGILDMSNASLTTHNVRGQVNVEREIGNGLLSGLAGGEVRQISIDRKNNKVYGYNDELKTNVPVDPVNLYPQVIDQWGTARIPTNNIMGEATTKYVSVFTNIAYALDAKYILSGSFRKDASNLFGVKSNNKWSPLWSIGASWNISNENFYKISGISLLRLRGSYGSSGNVIPGASSATTLRYLATPSIYTGTSRADVNNYKNDQLKWEKVKIFNIGIDFSTKRDKLSGSLEYYHKRAVDLYTSVPYDRTLGLGVNSLVKNNGIMIGDGVDVTLTSKNIKKSNFKWETILNISFNKDKVVETYYQNYYAGSFVGGGSVAKGYSRYPIFSVRFAGLDPQTGDPRGYINGHPSNNYNALFYDSARIEDLHYHGSATPRLFGNLGNTFQLYDFSLAFRLTFQFGHYFRRNSINYSSLFDEGKGHKDFENRWQAPGDEMTTTVPSMVYPADLMRDFFYAYSDPLILKADHIRLQYINLSYNFRKGKISRLPVKNIRLAFLANNLGLLWAANDDGLDPLYLDNSFPRRPTYSLNLSTNF